LTSYPFISNRLGSGSSHRHNSIVTSFTTICFSVSILLRSKFPFFYQESDVAVTTGLCLFIFETFIKEFIHACRHHSTKSVKWVGAFDTVPPFLQVRGGGQLPPLPHPPAPPPIVAKRLTYVSIPKVNISWVVLDVWTMLPSITGLSQSRVTAMRTRELTQGSMERNPN